MQTVMKKLRKELDKLRANRDGRSYIPKEYKLKVVKHSKDAAEAGMGITEFCRGVGIGTTDLYKWKNYAAGVVNGQSVSHGKRGRRYSLQTKIDVSMQVIDFGLEVGAVAKSFDISPITVHAWVDDYKKGLFSLSNATQISRKKFKSYDVLLGEIRSLEEQIREKKVDAREALELKHKQELDELEGL